MQSILVIRLSSLGDVILATALIRQISESFPGVAIDVAVDARFQDVWRSNPRVRSVYPVDRALRVNHELADCAKNEPYDVIVDLQRSRRSRELISSIDPSPHCKIVRIRKHRLEKLLLVWLKMRPSSITSVMQRYWQTVRDLGVAFDQLGPEIWSADGTSQSTQQRTRVGIAPGARHATKRWMPEAYAELIRMLVVDLQQRVVLLGGPDDVELCGRIEALAGVDLDRADGAPDLPTTVDALDTCQLVVSGDSAVMHLARARQVPVVAIFGSTVRELGFAPTGDAVRIVERMDVECRPCSHIGRDSCPKGHFDCMQLITPDDVLEAMTELMPRS